MASELHVLFLLKRAKKDKLGKSPLIIRLTYEKQRKQLSTPFQLSEKAWNTIENNSRTNDSELKAVKEFIKGFRAKIYTLSTKLELNNTFSLEELLEQYTGKTEVYKGILQLIDEHNLKLEERVGTDRAQSTLDKYHFLRDKIKAFIKDTYRKQDILITKLELFFLKDFVHFLITKHGNQHNTVTKYVKNLKAVVTYGIEQGYLKTHPFEGYRMGYKEVARSYLSSEELELLIKHKFANEKFELVRDLFLFQCCTGLAYVDMANLTRSNLTQGIDKKPWIVTQRQKTGTQSIIPLLPLAIVILGKYVHSIHRNDDKLLPTYAIQKYNVYLKELALVCGIDKPLSSHAGRRTFATTVALGNGVSLESISKVLGHTSTKITSIYAVVTDTKLSLEMQKLGDIKNLLGKY